MTSGAETHQNFPPNDSSQTWEILAKQIDTLIDAWEAGGDPPSLSDCLPEEPRRLRRLALTELIKVDLEYRWQQRNLPKRIEEYIEEFPELAEEGAIPCDLIYEEFHVRKQAGEAVNAVDYFERFPQQSEELGRLLGLESPHSTTSLFGPDKIKHVQVGDSIDDFDLLTQLGKGAFATVFLARQRSMQRLVALKVSANRGNEPQTMAQLDHPNIVRVFDQRVIPEDKIRLLYMQYVPAGTLHGAVEFIRKFPPSQRTGKHLLGVIDSNLADRGETPPADSSTRRRLANSTWPEAVCWLGARLAGALDYAHRQGILHRDVKPANVLLASDGSPKLADFNISCSSKLDGVTAAAYFGGSLAYMSPEQMEANNPKHDRQADSLDGRSDVYSLGIMLWELLTGSRPFIDESLDATWGKTLAELTARRWKGVTADAEAKLPANCPRGLKQVLLKCLEPDPEKRYQRAEEVARQLELCLKPQVQWLLRPPDGGWQSWVRHHPLWTLMGIAVGTNGLISILNIAYNHYGIVKHLTPEASDVFFELQLGAINGVLYFVGIVAGVTWAWQLLVALAKIRRGEEPDKARLPTARQKCLRFGHVVALISMAEWLVSGFLFPLGMSVLVVGEAGTGLTLWHWVHFLVSQVLCGLMASAFCFFPMTTLAVHTIYPMLVVPDSLDDHEVDRLMWLRRQVWVYFGLAVAVPTLAMTVLATIDMTVLQQGDMRPASVVLGIVGLLLSLFEFRLLRGIQRDTEAMALAVTPIGDSLGSGTDSFSARGDTLNSPLTDTGN